MTNTGKSVLVVEDEPLIRMNIAADLQDAGFIVLEAADADEALEILTARKDIQLVFTDIDMPGSMDGLKLAAAVRHRWPPVKIIVTSGHHSGAGDDTTPFFPKPYRPENIIATIRDLIQA
jgi:CheY-like chemotaxis protein